MDNSNVTPLHPKEKTKKEESSLVSALSPREIVSELDRFVVGQNKAKKAVAVALRNRWRRQALKGEMKNEVLPKNILKRFLLEKEHLLKKILLFDFFLLGVKV